MRRVETIDPSTLAVTLDGGEVLEAKAIILAMGVDWRRIAIPFIDHFIGRGVYYGAARSDAGLTQGKDVCLIGAANSAGQAAMNFSNYAKSVTLIVRAKSITQSMSQYLIEQIATKSNIRVLTRSEVVGLHGSDRLEAIDVVDRSTGSTSRRETAALFVMIGADAVTDWLPAEIERDSHGYVLTGANIAKTARWSIDRERFMLETSVSGIFAIGDVRSGSVKRVAAGVGEGGMAIAFVHECLQHSMEPVPPQR
jgi:thioredoxin reductase (NADPH)